MERRLRNTSCDAGNGAVGDVILRYLRLHYVTACFYPTGSIVFGPCRSSAAGSYVIPSNPPSLLVHSAANPQVFKPTISKHPTSHKMRVATLVLVAFSAVALALPTTNNVERAAADANVRQMDELTVAAISK
ncbi:uncharacterized protein BO87DRAFT_393963 [Aspergillus neoniger CBS 115656]|uniref:Uncharacterized protein n=1 Tax=Aspergillus neoniger (strain CBS 115656) TaxID=1448310 RepID=A0A318YSK2_ASPNB|nr:hypothetical protein BO87DRAFT_393963 [Aspergillus neoniger CBS 115656]PYH37695.1 hypothetical protein BO87DRAFT_393963 [Aspergillus neoniger CBS 115656]